MLYSKENIIKLPIKGIKNKMENPDIFKHLQDVFPHGAKGLFNIQKKYFEEVDENTTNWILYNELIFNAWCF
jgi:hypothetical protein